MCIKYVHKAVMSESIFISIKNKYGFLKQSVGSSPRGDRRVPSRIILQHPGFGSYVFVININKKKPIKVEKLISLGYIPNDF